MVAPSGMSLGSGGRTWENKGVDGGPGANLQDRVFDRFTTSSDQGTGLGLHIVRELARAQAGDASYRSEENAFVVRLPRAASPK
jgi:signal transduction histidine kinase